MVSRAITLPPIAACNATPTSAAARDRSRMQIARPFPQLDRDAQSLTTHQRDHHSLE